jgi:hypothetical protein
MTRTKRGGGMQQGLPLGGASRAGSPRYEPFVPGSNPRLPDFIAKHATPYDPETDTYDVPAFDRDRVVDKAAPPKVIYDMHTYWTSRTEAAGLAGLVLADFELLYAHDLGKNDSSLARQVANSGKRVCWPVPGARRDGRLWTFDEDGESRRKLREALVFKNSGRVFELREEGR